MKLNWRDASKELPEDDNGFMPNCIVIYSYVDCDGVTQRSVDMDWYKLTTDISDDGEFYIGRWLENDGKVTHWIYADELPLPDYK